MDTDANARSEYLEKYRYAHDFWAPYQEDARIYSLSASGYTWSDDERRALIAEGREPIEYNIQRRPLEFFSGYLRDNINQVIYAPVEGSDEKTADQFTKLSYYIWDKGFGYPVFLDAADECLKAGMSLCGIRMDYSKDFINGDISFFKRTYNSFYLDPTFESINLEDCDFAITRDLINKEYAKQLLPDVSSKDIDEIQWGFRDDKFLRYHPQFTNFSRNKNLLAYDQYYQRVTKTRKFLVDERSGFYRDITDLPSEDLKRLKNGIKRFDDMRKIDNLTTEDDLDIPQVKIQDVDRGFVELNVMLNGERVYCGEDATGINQTYPFAPLICYMEPSIWMPSQRIMGIPACTWSLQRQFNKRHMKITDMMDTSISTGYKYLIGSVSDPQDLQQSGQNKIIGIDPENAPEGMNSVQELQGGSANQSLVEYQSILDKLSLTLSNVNESVMGIDEKGNTQVSGRLAEVRIAQGLRGNRKIFDNIENAQQVLGGLIMKCIQAKYPAGKVERIIAEKPTEQFYEKQFELYDAVIKEGVRSKSQRDAYYYELVQLKKDGIVDVPQDEIIEALAMAGITDLKDSIKAREEQQAQEKALIAQETQAKMDVLNATTEEKLGLAQERRSRVISNLSLKDERESEAQQNIAQAALDRAKAITEIAGMKQDQLIRVLEVINELERQEAEGREAQKAQVQAQSDMINAETEGSAENKQVQEQAQMQQTQNQLMNQFNQGG